MSRLLENSVNTSQMFFANPATLLKGETFASMAEPAKLENQVVTAQLVLKAPCVNTMF